MDSPVNRQVKWALKEIAKNQLARPWKGKILQLVSLLNDVGEEPFAKGRVVAREYAEYGPLLEMLTLFFEGKGVDAAFGSVATSAFFFQLFDVFERAVFSALREAAGEQAIRSPTDRSSAKHTAGSPDLGVTFKPDMGLKSRPTVGLKTGDGAWKLVVDAKYASVLRHGRWRPSYVNEHIYQILAYSKVFSCPGVLVYPRIDSAVDIRYRIDDTIVRIVTVDIASGSAEAIRELCRELNSEFAPKP